MGVNLEEECRRYELELRGGNQAGSSSGARRAVEVRAYQVLAGSRLLGRKVLELEQLVKDARLFVERLRRGDQTLDPDETTIVQSGDTLAITGRRELLIARLDEQALGLREVDDKSLLNIPAEALDVVVTNGDIDGHSLAEVADDEVMRSVYLRHIMRAGTEVPILPGTQIQRGDVLTMVGPVRRLAAAVGRIGVPDRATDATNMVLVAFGIVAGALIGLPSLMVGRLEIGLSLSVGVLLGGLVCGWMRSMWPRFVGRIPSPTLWVFESLGLAGFVAAVGLNAGPDFVVGLRTSGPSLLVAGVITVLVPNLVGVVVGRWVFKMHPAVLLGVCAGAGTATPALAAIQEAAKSTVPTLGYGVAYAVGNVLLALWGAVIVALI
jgi:putative transport protein